MIQTGISLAKLVARDGFAVVPGVIHPSAVEALAEAVDRAGSPGGDLRRDGVCNEAQMLIGSRGYFGVVHVTSHFLDSASKVSAVDPEVVVNLRRIYKTSIAALSKLPEKVRSQWPNSSTMEHYLTPLFQLPMVEEYWSPGLLNMLAVQ